MILTSTKSKKGAYIISVAGSQFAYVNFPARYADLAHLVTVLLKKYKCTPRCTYRGNASALWALRGVHNTISTMIESARPLSLCLFSSAVGTKESQKVHCNETVNFAGFLIHQSTTNSLPITSPLPTTTTACVKGNITPTSYKRTITGSTDKY